MKYFNVNNPGQPVTITGEQASFYQLSDGNMIKKDAFASKYQPVLEGFEDDHIESSSATYNASKDFIDPNSFFNTKTGINTTDIEKIKSIDPSSVNEVNDFNRTQVVNKGVTSEYVNTNESLVTQVEDTTIPNNTNIDVSQYKVYDDDEDAYNDLLQRSSQEQPQRQKPQQPQESKQKTFDPMIDINVFFEDEKLAYGEEEATKRKNKRLAKLNTPIQEENTNIPQSVSQTAPLFSEAGNQTPNYPQIDPIKMMFSTFKRSHEILFNVQFKDKIANPDFIKMMMENMDGDIIGYYKKMIMDNIMKNLHVIEGVVEKELQSILGEEIEIIKPTKQKKIIPNVPKEEISKLQEGSEIKSPKSRKPRTKKVQDDSKIN